MVPTIHDEQKTKLSIFSRTWRHFWLIGLELFFFQLFKLLPIFKWDRKLQLNFYASKLSSPKVKHRVRRTHITNGKLEKYKLQQKRITSIMEAKFIEKAMHD